jgi:hypothetical protein
MSTKIILTQGHGIWVRRVEILECTFHPGYHAVINPPDQAYPEEPPEIEITKAVIEDDDGNMHDATDKELEDLQKDDEFWESAEIEIGEYLSDRDAAADESGYEDRRLWKH